MIGISFVKILNSEVVDGECESSPTFVAFQETWGEANRCTSTGRKMLLELIVGEKTGFLETTHSIANLQAGAAL
jgi:hypothetical protein